MDPTVETTVLVVGAGAAGLKAGHDLQKNGVDVLVLEAAPRIGGRVYSVTSKIGSHLDLGGQWIGHGHHRLTKLAAEAKATVYKTYTKGTPRIVGGGRSKPLWSPSVLLGAVILLIFDLIRRVWIPSSWNVQNMEEAISTFVPLATTRELLRIIVAITSTAELDQYSVRSFADAVYMSGGILTMTGTHGGAQDSLIVESMDSIIGFLSSTLGSSRVFTSTRVTSVRDGGAAGITVTVDTGRVFHANKVIATVPPPMMKSIQFEPPLPKIHQILQDDLQMGVVYKAIAVFERPFWRDKLSECIILDEPACGIFDSSSPGGPGHLCFLVPGTPARLLDTLDVHTRQQKLLSTLLPFAGRKILEPLEWHEKPWHLDEFCGGGYAAFPIVGKNGDMFPSVCQPVGNIHWAGTERAQEHPGYIEGALQSGERAAREIMSALQN